MVDVRWHVFFLCHNKHKGGMIMCDELLEKILSHKDSHKIPYGCQATMIAVFEECLEMIREVNPYATVSELLSTDATTNNV